MKNHIRWKKCVYKNDLYLPTDFQKYNKYYYIVDCYNNRILRSRDYTQPINTWQVIDHDLSWPHSIAYGEGFFVVDDTEANRFIVYTEQHGNLIRYSTIALEGKRPHKVVYDAQTRAFFAINSASQQIVRLDIADHAIKKVHEKKLEFLQKSYCRSLKFINGACYIVSGHGRITIIDHRNSSYAVLESYSLPKHLHSMNDINYFDGWFYISASMGFLVRVRELSDLSLGKYEDVVARFGIVGNPYAINIIDHTMYVTAIGDNENTITAINKGDTYHTIYHNHISKLQQWRAWTVLHLHAIL